MKERCEELERALHHEVPLSETLGVRVHGYDGQRLELRARLEANVNIYGVAFGGSIYSVCALSGWGLLTLRLEEIGLEPRIMIAGGEIDYSKPVAQTINAVSRLPDAAAFDRFVARYREKGRARIEVQAHVELDDGSEAARFTGEFIAFEKTAKGRGPR